MGCVTALGNTLREFSHGLQEGRSGIQPIQTFDTSAYKVKIAAQCGQIRPLIVNDKYKHCDPYVVHAALAANEAVFDAGLEITDEISERSAVIFATGIGGQNTMESSLKKVHENSTRLHPMTVPRLIPSTAASQISIDHNIQGPAFTTTSACASSGHAIATAVMMIRCGLIDVAIVGGSESLIEPGCLRAWEALRVLASDTCRPFSAKRQGMVLGEGAGALVLESVQHARTRGAKIYAELAGIGMASDADHMVRPSVSGPISAMLRAMHDARVRGSEVDYINAHGTGTALNDETESKAIQAVFGEQALEINISSTKAMHGHAMGAGSALELIATVLCMQHSFIAPTLNYLGQDPKCPLNYTPNSAVERSVQVALSNSFAFGGLNVCLALKRLF